MAKIIKIVLLTALVLMVVLAALTETAWVQNIMRGLNLAIYLRLASLFGLFIAVIFAWGYKKKVEASQKYQRAQQVIAQAEIAAERRQRGIEQMEEKMKDRFAQKEKAWNEEVNRMKTDYHERIAALKEQNVRLKETVAKLMQAVKKKA